MVFYSSTLTAKETSWVDGLSLGIGHANGGADTYRLQFFFCDKSTLLKPYVELGLGIAYLSNKLIYDDRVQQRNLSSHWQFEDKMSIGFQMNQYDLNIRFLHYSNAEFQNPNDGMDMVQMTLTYHMVIF